VFAIPERLGAELFAIPERLGAELFAMQKGEGLSGVARRRKKERVSAGKVASLKSGLEIQPSLHPHA
jgi:hypothetical protein